MTNSNNASAARAALILAEVEGDVTALTKELNSPDPSLRTLALGGLGRLDALTDDDLAKALTDDDRDVRCRALEIAIPHTHIDLTTLLSDPDDLVVETAAFALGEREHATPEVIEALSHVGTSHDVSICREAAIAALGAIGDEAGLPTILGGLDDRAPVRRRAVLALAPFDTPEVTDALTRATKDRDRQVRQAAEDLL